MIHPRPNLAKTTGELLFALSLLLVSTQAGHAAIISDAIATGDYQNAPIVSNRASSSVDIEPARPEYEMAVSALLDDGDGDGLGDVGEKVIYTFTFTNTGNMTLKNLKVDEQFLGISEIICTGDEDGDGDIDALLPSLSDDCSASYLITRSDLFEKSIDTLATSQATSADGSTAVIEDESVSDNITSILIDQIDDLYLRNTASAPTLVFPNIYEIDYKIEIENAGTLTHSQLRLIDDLRGAVTSPGRLISTSVVEMKNFSGTGTLNGSFDGVDDVQVFSGDVQLAPGETGYLRIRVRIDTSNQPFLSLSAAFITSAIIEEPIPSDDPSQTPENLTDANPAEILIFDTDMDGVGNDGESDVADDDGDGIPDIDDHYPTGNLYCETDGRILRGGQIAIQNITTSGIQIGTGKSNNITIVKDGSDGQYQFYVNKAGTYRVSIVKLPKGAPLSTRRIAGPALDARLDLPVDANGLPPTNSVKLGSAVSGDPPVLIDLDEAANPYYMDFKMVEFDPVIFNNNIPFSDCTNPNLMTSVTIVKGPVRQTDGSASITYRLSARNTGTHFARNFQMSTDLAAIFGAENYVIHSIELESNSEDGDVTLNPVFDGNASSNLIVSHTRLSAGKAVSILLELETNVATGIYSNEVRVSGINPFDGSELNSAIAEAAIEISRPNEKKLSVSAIAGTVDMKLGHQFLLTVATKNPEAYARENGEIIVRIPEGFNYVPGTGKINGAEAEPLAEDRQLIWAARRFPAGELMIAQIALRLGGEVSDQKFTTSAFIRSRKTGELISNLAKTEVSLAIEPLFNCSDILGRVFHDVNGNGSLDAGETGLSNVRLETVGGLRPVTDSFGRFQVACSAIPDGQIGADFDMKLDITSLPSGFHLTSENPVVVRLTMGGLTKVNFGATQLREIQLGLQNQSFSGDSIRLTPIALGRVAQLLTILEEKPSVLKVVYSTDAGSNSDGDTLANARIEAVKALLEAAWKGSGEPYKLTVELQMN